MSHRFYYLIFSSVLSFICSSCSKNEKQVFAPPPPVVTTALATSDQIFSYIEAIGTAVASQVVNILPQVTGQIIDVHFVDGAEVKAGDPLFTLDVRPYKAAYEQSLAQWKQNLAILNFNQYVVESYRGLLVDDFVSKLDFKQYQSNVLTANALVDQYAALTEANKLNIDYCHIASPLDGKAGKILIEAGNLVMANQTNPLVVLNKLCPIYIDFTISERQSDLLFGFLKEHPLSVEVTSGDGLVKKIDADLTFVDNTIDSATGTLALRATFANEDKSLWPGQFLRAKLLLQPIENAILIPSESIMMNTKGPYVFVIKPDQTAELRMVQLGQRYGHLQHVIQGVQEGESVVTLGQMNLRTGSKVQVKAL